MIATILNKNGKNKLNIEINCQLFQVLNAWKKFNQKNRFKILIYSLVKHLTIMLNN